MQKYAPLPALTIDLDKPHGVADTPETADEEKYRALGLRPPEQQGDEDGHVDDEGEEHDGHAACELDHRARHRRRYGVNHAEADHHVADVADAPGARHESLFRKGYMPSV